MKLYIYKKTSKTKSSKMLLASLISVFVLFFTIFLSVVITLSTGTQNTLPFVITLISCALLAVILVIRFYDMDKAYIVTEDKIIRVVRYPFLKKREKIVPWSDIHEIKQKIEGVLGRPAFLILKNQKNKTLFRIIDTLETRACFETLGYKINF